MASHLENLDYSDPLKPFDDKSCYRKELVRLTPVTKWYDPQGYWYLCQTCEERTFVFKEKCGQRVYCVNCGERFIAGLAGLP